MQVSGPLVDSKPQKLIDRPHYRRSPGEIAQIVQIVLCGRCFSRRREVIRLLGL